MSVRRPFAGLTLLAMAMASSAPESAKAGPLCDWLFGKHKGAQPAYPVGSPVPVGNVANMPVMPVTGAPGAGYPVSGYAANYGNYYGSMMPVIGPGGYGYPAAQPPGAVAAVAPTIMSYVPDYRTSQYRAPVTYYRPLMTTDPNTGSQVVALAPCTSYEYQTQRVPTFGYNGVIGSYSTPPVQAAPPAMPTYTLPSGGIPLAAGRPTAILPPASNAYAMGYGGYAAPNPTPYGGAANAPAYSSNYGSYSPQQPALTAPPAGNYPSQPFSTTPGYYGAASGGSNGGSTGGPAGGSTGSYISPSYTPGLVSPQGTIGLPSTQAPANSYPAAPSSPNNYPLTPAPGSVYPGRDASGDVPPSLPVLPPSGSNAMLDRPHLRAIVRQPANPNSAMNNSASNEQAKPQSESSRPLQSPTMDPIPAPADLDQQPRWNPGLLNEQDRTALRPAAPNSPQYAGQSKPIQWASFRSESEPRTREVPAESPAQNPALPSGLRPIPASPSASTPANYPASNPASPAANPRPARQYSTGGWNTAK